MKKINNYIHKRKKDGLSNITGNKKLFSKIINDMKNNAGNFSPRMNWHLVDKTQDELSGDITRASDDIYSRYDRTAYLQNFSSVGKILGRWIGGTGKKKIDIGAINKYEDFLTKIDFLELFETLKKQYEKLDYKVTDLGTIIDINLISGLIDTHIEKLNILEVGGGYGRLAEAFLNVYKGQVKYVMLDSVPASLMFAYLYLKNNYPDLKIGMYYNNDEFDMNKFDLYIIPSWHFESLNNLDYDVCINIESMQEMLQFHVDYYLNLFNKLTKDEGLIYISNSHDYFFKGHWKYPENWERLMSFNTPRSWTDNHPTEIFKKKDISYKTKNSFIEAGFNYHLNKEIIWKEKYNDLTKQLEKVRRQMEESRHLRLRKIFKIKLKNYNFTLFLKKKIKTT